MGKPTGFLEYERTRRTGRRLQRKESNILRNFTRQLSGRGAAAAGSTLYGMRRSLLPGGYNDCRNGCRDARCIIWCRSVNDLVYHGNWEQAYVRLVKDH